jgi:ElaB/YqjD/DUF883 family membrane-anchored ribosome-binding protein
MSMDEKGHNVGTRAAEAISSAANKAGGKVDSALDYVNEKTHEVNETLRRASQEGWDGVRRRASDCARNAPLTTFLTTIGIGIVVGWLLGRGVASE